MPDDDTLAMEVVGSGPALLLIHGAGGSPRANYPFLDRLSRHYTVLAPDLPGVGRSAQGSTPLTVADVSRKLLRTLDQVGVDTFAVCGYSMGTLLASWLAADVPERVTAIALTAGLARPLWSCQDVLARWDKLLDADPDELGRFIVDRVYRPETISTRGNAWYANTVREVGAGFPPGTRAHIDLISHADVRASVAATRQPLLLVVPTYDEFVTPDHSDELQRLRPDAHVTPVAAGHSIGDESETVWFDALTRFLTQHTSPSPIREGIQR